MNPDSKTPVRAVLGYPIRTVVSEPEVLLGLGLATKKIGARRWCGFGGSIDGDKESPVQAMVREFREETTLETSPDKIEPAGKITFHNMRTDGTFLVVEVQIFRIVGFTGTPTPTGHEFDKFQWFPVSNLPLFWMMCSDKLWLPKVLAGQSVTGTSRQKDNQSVLIGEPEFVFSN